MHHRTAVVNGRTVFYREAGDPASPTLVLLHGFPTASHMFRRLIIDLADSYHLIAPDHIGFGYSDAPAVAEFEYSFDNLTTIALGLLDQLGLDQFALYLQDYGAPIGLRIASRQPDRVAALIVQSGNAYTEGFTPFWDLLFAHAKDRAGNEAAVRKLLELDATRWQYTHGVPTDRLDRLTPWTLDQALLDRPGNREVQLQLFYDYQFIEAELSESGVRGQVRTGGGSVKGIAVSQMGGAEPSSSRDLDMCPATDTPTTSAPTVQSRQVSPDEKVDVDGNEQIHIRYRLRNALHRMRAAAPDRRSVFVDEAVG
ncbi:alpha/beta fold hydrolase [Kribbella sp. NPDC050124]|uniref:alpha/beta fold hydrolase n=1 Tax=Kribbella sp. NPDC050124 TaxID=3364114 RepID=UPI00378916E4